MRGDTLNERWTTWMDFPEHWTGNNCYKPFDNEAWQNKWKYIFWQLTFLGFLDGQGVPWNNLWQPMDLNITLQLDVKRKGKKVAFILFVCEKKLSHVFIGHIFQISGQPQKCENPFDKQKILRNGNKIKQPSLNSR